MIVSLHRSFNTLSFTLEYARSFRVISVVRHPMTSVFSVVSAIEILRVVGDIAS